MYRCASAICANAKVRSIDRSNAVAQAVFAYLPACVLRAG